MLKTIRLKNFKLHEDTQIEAAPITIFIGPNNSGKSSIFQALLLLRQAAARNDQFLCQPPRAFHPPRLSIINIHRKFSLTWGRFPTFCIELEAT